MACGPCARARAAAAKAAAEGRVCDAAKIVAAGAAAIVGAATKEQLDTTVDALTPKLAPKVRDYQKENAR